MNEYFIIANSFAAPFFSDTSHCFQEGENPKEALELFVQKYNHPCGLYAAMLYKDANAYHKGENPLLKWLSNHAAFLGGKTGAIYVESPGRIRINGKWHEIPMPKAGQVLEITN